MEFNSVTQNSNSEIIQNNSLDRNKANSNSENSESGRLPENAVAAPCRAGKFILVGEKGRDDLFEHVRSFCKSYRCEFCGPRKLFLIEQAFRKAIEEFELNVFATLTLDRRQCTPENSVKYIRKCWDKFRIIQKRRFGRNLDFVAVVEFQKKGYAHLHILFNQYIPHDWLKTKWMAVGGGSVVHIKQSNLRSAKYLAKYLGKQMRDFPELRMRFYSTSQSIKLRKLIGKTSDIKFDFVKMSEPAARYILEPFIKENLLDRKNRILGFKAERRLNTSKPTT